MAEPADVAEADVADASEVADGVMELEAVVDADEVDAVRFDADEVDAVGFDADEVDAVGFDVDKVDAVGVDEDVVAAAAAAAASIARRLFWPAGLLVLFLLSATKGVGLSLRYWWIEF